MSSDVSRDASDARLPRNYRTILAAIRAAERGHHLTAYDVFERARREQPRLGFATVHRALARLHELGYVLKLDVPGASSAVFEPTAAPHAHFRCSTCGVIVDVEFRIARDQLAALSARLGVEIATETTTFAGRCAGCSAISAN